MSLDEKVKYKEDIRCVYKITFSFYFIPLLLLVCLVYLCHAVKAITVSVHDIVGLCLCEKEDRIKILANRKQKATNMRDRPRKNWHLFSEIVPVCVLCVKVSRSERERE